MSSHEREVIGVDDRVSVGRAIPLGIQHMMSMFGSTVLVPVLTGLDPNVAIMCSGIGTICYLLVTRQLLCLHQPHPRRGRHAGARRRHVRCRGRGPRVFGGCRHH